jgi:hypothetical protein
MNKNNQISPLITVTIALLLVGGITVLAVYPSGYTLVTSGTATAVLSTTEAHSSPNSVKMATITTSDRARIIFASGPTLSSVNALSYWAYAVQAGDFNQLTAWVGLYLHTIPGKTFNDWITDYLAGSPNVYYIQAEPYYTEGPPPLNTWEKYDAYDTTYPLKWESLEGGYSPHYAPTLADYISGAAMNYPKPGGGTSSYASREYGTLYVSAIVINMGYGGPWANTLAYVDDVTIADYFENFDPIPIMIDIRPDTDPNCINLGSKGRVPVAILTTLDFDASTVDPVTVQFANAWPLRWTMKDVDADGDLDMLLFFKTQELDLVSSSTDATLIGATFGGKSIVGTDAVDIVPHK